MKKLLKLCLLCTLVITLVACTTEKENESVIDTNNITSSDELSFDQDSIPQATIQFGDEGQPFTITFENNETALFLARNITSAGRRLPIYHYDDFENYEYFQYYDVPSSYSIPSQVETVSSQEAGDIYYMAPNRIMLFYRDAHIEGEMTKVGHIDNVEGLQSAVEDNPVLEGWTNKIVVIQYAE